MTRVRAAGLMMVVLCAPLIFAALCRAQDAPSPGAAEKAQAEAETLLGQNTAEARRRAAVKLAEAARLWQQNGDARKEAVALFKLVELSNMNGDSQKALEFARRLLPLARRLADRTLEGEALYHIGAFTDDLGDTRAGLPLVKQAAELFAALGDRQRAALALNLLGILYSNIGEMTPAIDYLQRSLALRRAVRDRPGEARTIINLGTIYNDTGEYRTAAEFYEQALKIAEEEKDVRTQSSALNNLGFVRHALGEYQKALESYEKARAIRRETGDTRGEATALNNLGSVYRTLGETKTALEMINEALAIYQKGGFRRNEATSLASLGAIHNELGNAPKALEYHRRALDIQRAIGNKDGQTTALRNISLIYLERGQPAEASATLEEALRLSVEIGNREKESDVLLTLARAAEQSRRDDEAAAHYERALAIRREMGLLSQAPETLYHYARFEARAGRRAAALEKMSEVMRLIENLRGSIAGASLRSSFFAEKQRYFDFYIALLTAAHEEEPQRGFDALAFKASEAARARSLLEFLGASRVDVRPASAPEPFARARLLRQTINAKETQRLAAVRVKESTKADVYETELAELVRQYRELQAEILRASPQFASLTNPQPLDLAGIQTRVLDEDSVLLEYFLGEERSALFFVTKNRLEIFALPARAAIESVARQTLDGLKARGQEIAGETPVRRAARLKKADLEAEQGLARLSEMLLAPVAGKIRNKRLLVVASGVLQYVPFAALPVDARWSSAGDRMTDPKTKTEDQRPKTKNPFLIETNEIVTLPSASVVPVLRQNKARPRQPKNLVAILADPVFSADDPRLKTAGRARAPATGAGVEWRAAAATPARSGFGRLRFSRAEAAAIYALAPTDRRFVATDFAANLETVNGESLRKASIVHFATHGIIDSNYPELSGVVLSLVDENGRQQDGVLRLHDVYNLRLDADLVVLSACETALGKEIKGEGIVGLARGFMHAGAAGVAASLWRVDDRATAELMKRFYRKMLVEKLAPAAALREAQTSLIREKSSAHPFFWAGFTLQGDWRP